MAIDPVCGMTVDEATAPARSVHRGTTYYFCAPGCKRTFEADPEAVLGRGPRPMGMAAAQPSPLITLQPRRAPQASATSVPPGPPASGPPQQTGPAASDTVTIPIEGMSCASCVAKIEEGLQALPGVTRASVNLATEQATVDYQPGIVGPAKKGAER